MAPQPSSNYQGLYVIVSWREAIRIRTALEGARDDVAVDLRTRIDRTERTRALYDGGRSEPSPGGGPPANDS